MRLKAESRTTKKKDDANWNDTLHEVIPVEQIGEMTTVGLGTIGIEWAEDIEMIRSKCRSFHGGLSGLKGKGQDITGSNTHLNRVCGEYWRSPIPESKECGSDEET